MNVKNKVVFFGALFFLSFFISNEVYAFDQNFLFERNLAFGSPGEDVRMLQKYLNEQGFNISTSGPGSIGQETTYFGLGTKNALKLFQNTFKAEILTPAGLSQGSGVFSIRTRDFVNQKITESKSIALVDSNESSAQAVVPQTSKTEIPNEAITDSNTNNPTSDTPVMQKEQPKFYLAGEVTGLMGTLIVHNNGRELLSITKNGSFSFKDPLAFGDSYKVQISAQPMAPRQNCTISNGQGFIFKDTLEKVSINCVNDTRSRTRTAQTYTIGGTISGLGNGMVLQLNGANNLSITTGQTVFSFSSGLTTGSAYSVTVLTQPLNDTCSVINSSGTVTNSNITNVAVVCIGNA